MPIANTTVVNTVKKSRKDSSKQTERSQREKSVEEIVPPTLFEIKESKYHEDIFARG